jgi:hypothetical protein
VFSSKTLYLSVLSKPNTQSSTYYTALNTKRIALRFILFKRITTTTFARHSNYLLVVTQKVEKERRRKHSVSDILSQQFLMSSANHHLGGGPSRFSTAQPPPASHQPHDTDTDADLFDDLDEDTYRALYETETQYLSQYATIPDTSQHASISVLSISSEDPLPSQDRLQSHGEISMLRNNLIQASH